MTIVEILVALALGAFLTTSIIKVVSSNKQNVKLADSSVQVQESARLGLELLARDMRMAGYRGCLNNASGANYNSLLAGGNPFFHNYINRRVDVIDNFNPANSANYVINGLMPAAAGFGAKLPQLASDVFIMRSAVSSNIYTNANAVAVAQGLNVSGSDLAFVENGRILIVSDCQNADIFVAGNMPTGTSPITFDVGQVGFGGVTNNTGALSQLYLAGSQISFMNTAAYFIAPSDVITEDYNNDTVNDVLSLYKFSQLNGLQELIPYVSDFQLEYGVDSGTGVNADGQLDAYVTGSDASLAIGTGSTDRIISIRITLSVASRNDNVDQRVVGDPNFDQFDRFRRDYIKVIELRNVKTGF